MAKLKNNFHTGKTQREPDNNITLDSNMVGYLYVLSSPQLDLYTYENIKKKLTKEQFGIIKTIINNNFEGISFNTTPQVIHEVIEYAKTKNDYNVINFLSKICHTHIPKDRTAKEKYAELIVDLMDDYLAQDIFLSNTTREPQSAIRGETKNGLPNFADAKIASENCILNGDPLVTHNEKHLVSMNVIKIRNNLRSMAILDKNKKFLKSHKVLIPNKTIRRHLNSEKSTTFRISDIPHILDL